MGLYPFQLGSLRTTPYILNFVYEGQVYSTFHEFMNIPNNNSRYIQIKTGARIVHVFNSRYSSAGGADVLVSIYEGATLTNGTTPPSLAPQGFDRRIGASAPSLTSIFVDPTGINTASATLIARLRLYNSGGGNGGADINTDNLERVLQPNTSYLIQITPTGSTIDFSWNMDFYESGN